MCILVTCIVFIRKQPLPKPTCSSFRLAGDMKPCHSLCCSAKHSVLVQDHTEGCRHGQSRPASHVYLLLFAGIQNNTEIEHDAFDGLALLPLHLVHSDPVRLSFADSMAGFTACSHHTEPSLKSSGEFAGVGACSSLPSLSTW